MKAPRTSAFSEESSRHDRCPGCERARSTFATTYLVRLLVLTKRRHRCETPPWACWREHGYRKPRAASELQYHVGFDEPRGRGRSGRMCGMISAVDLRVIAGARLEDAKVLAANGRSDGAAYVCGYAIELALKARIADTLNWKGFPEHAASSRTSQASERTSWTSCLLFQAKRSESSQITLTTGL